MIYKRRTPRRKRKYEHKNATGITRSRRRELKEEGWQRCHHPDHCGPLVRCIKKEKVPK